MGWTQILEKVFVPFIRLYVNVNPVLLNLIKNDYQIMIHQLNQYMPMLKTGTIGNNMALQRLEHHGILIQ